MGKAGRKWGDLTAHIPDQRGLSSAGREGGHAGQEEEERKKHTSPRTLQPLDVSDIASKLLPRFRDPPR